MGEYGFVVVLLFDLKRLFCFDGNNSGGGKEEDDDGVDLKVNESGWRIWIGWEIWFG